MSKAADLASLASASETALSNRNIVINGAMQVAQRSASVTGIGASAGYFTLDRWKITQLSAGRLTMTQTADGPSGFANCLKLDCTTADASIAAGENLVLQHKLEGQDLQQLKKGTSDAEQITVSFYVKANAAFNFGVELFDNDNTRQITKLFATTTGWVKHSITFPADTTGAFDDDNALSLDLNFWLHAGSTYASGTLNTAAWASNTNANRAAGIGSFYSSTDNNFFITGIQMEVGPVATPFEHRSYGQELALCQRYYYRHADHSENSANSSIGIGFYYSSGLIMVYVNFKQSMRSSTPTLEFASGSNYYILQRAGATDGVNDFAIQARGTNGCKIENSDEASGTAGESGIMMTDNGAAYIAFDAEL